MTSDQQKDFEHQWPALAARVNRLLRRKRLSGWLVEDLTQETGLRLIRMWPTIDQNQPLWPLTATIALNLMRDEMRRDSSHELTYGVPETASSENVERRGMARVELRAVGGALARMPDTQRRVLLADVADADKAPDASATRMLRMRARRKLQNLLDHASLLGIAVGDHLRRAAREAELMISRVLPNQMEHLSAAAVSLLAAISLGIAVVPDSPSEAGERASAPPARTTTAAEGGADASASRAARHGSGRLQRGSATRGTARAARRGDGGLAKRRQTSKGSTNADEGAPFPGAVNYGARLTEDTYVRGTIEAEIVGGEVGGDRDSAPPRGVGSINCTVSPARPGAACTHSGQGWDERGVRAQHEGEAVVAGRRIY